MYLLLLALFVVTTLASTLDSPPTSNDVNPRATCERINFPDRLKQVYCFEQTHCYGWTLNKFLPETELNAHPTEDTAACYNTDIYVKSCWYTNPQRKDLGCKMWDLPNCQGNVLHVPASNIDAKWFMRDFSRAKPGWSGRINSLKCYRMNAAGGPA
ncbi:hypothetical protein GRF29_44g1083137 [Pseudopithomyces chartarum]|uniref:Uncharacterized protein n=1 Tax=Pseudopithomyces chartarum TaxID=1892770 RepID=A0AAN6M2L3_9PLEO|nr:hypothetical protein GRF29_44g1083137 [Pseudopithomyces chartarum]